MSWRGTVVFDRSGTHEFWSQGMEAACLSQWESSVQNFGPFLFGLESSEI